MISIVLPVYNMESCLADTLDSILSQTYCDFELICIDDGSEDASLSILRRYEEKDGRIRVFAQENAGPAAARNKGLELASGEYVTLLDADDLYDKRFLGLLHERALTTSADVVVCRSSEIDHRTGSVSPSPWTAKIEQIPRKDPFSCDDMNDYILTAFIGWPWDKLYRRSFIEENGLRFPELKNSEDLYFVFLSLVIAERISFLDEVLIQHRVNRSGSVSNSRLSNSLDFYKAICLLKDRLRMDVALYERLSWGFLNWAFDYTLWNIESLPPCSVRRDLIIMLRNGAFEELELSSHGCDYFALTPRASLRYKKLLSEVEDVVDGYAGELGDAHPKLDYVVSYIVEAQRKGFRTANRTLFAWLRRRFMRSSSGEPDPEARGRRFIYCTGDEVAR